VENLFVMQTRVTFLNNILFQIVKEIQMKLFVTNLVATDLLVLQVSFWKNVENKTQLSANKSVLPFFGNQFCPIIIFIN
jgi:hypothetical protein